ncbi:phage integrase N-terminal SAM-like domain-containing protein [Cohnella fermenti]|uniref:Integrase SAM-like N-terminal domain-containing protein n=1 Tax=Cohnella fermenti TaxID=2565925 RepID=A0A4S4BK48_9BACL|nr:hypothetical protein E6C55_33480 [Cohnella fermenti]
MSHHEQIVSKLQEDLLLRGFALHTQQSYMRCARAFLAYCHRPVEQLGGNDIRHFLLGMDAPLVYQLFRQEHSWVAKCGRDKR